MVMKLLCDFPHDEILKKINRSFRLITTVGASSTIREQNTFTIEYIDKKVSKILFVEVQLLFEFVNSTSHEECTLGQCAMCFILQAAAMEDKLFGCQVDVGLGAVSDLLMAETEPIKSDVVHAAKRVLLEGNLSCLMECENVKHYIGKIVKRLDKLEEKRT
jgi:hypothetical protein